MSQSHFASTATGKVDTVTYQDGSTVHFTYDQHDRLSAMADALGATSYSRDAAGRVTSVTDPNGNRVYARHGRDLMGCKSPVCKPSYCREDRNINTSRKQGRFREKPSGGSWSAKL